MALTILSQYMFARPFEWAMSLFFYQFNVRFIKFYNRMLKCENPIVNFIAKLAQVNYNGSLSGVTVLIL